MKRYECIGGPLCGEKVEAPKGKRDFCYGDDHNRPHFYRLIRVARDDYSAVATYYHYFGSNIERASTASPTLRPPERLYKTVKRY